MADTLTTANTLNVLYTGKNAKTGEDKSYTLTIPNPIDGITEQQIKNYFSDTAQLGSWLVDDTNTPFSSLNGAYTEMKSTVDFDLTTSS